jgi:glycosyltransferase involved in cell wall biosynthesis
MIQFWWELFSPRNEGVSKEVALLRKKVDGFVCASTNSRWSNSWLEFDNKQFVFDARLIPLMFAPSVFESIKNTSVNHVFVSYASWRQALLFSLFRKPIVLTVTSCFERVKKLPLENVNMIVLESLKDFDLFAERVGVSKVRVVMPCVDLKRFKPSREREFNGKRPIEVLFASSCVNKTDFKNKGVLALLDAVKIVDGVNVVFAWRGSHKNLLLKEIKKRGLVERVEVTDFIVNAPKLFNGCDVVFAVFSSKVGKSVPNSALEGLACGKPVLVSKESGLSELVDGKCGASVVLNPTKIVAALKKIKRGYRVYSINARKLAVKSFSEERFVKNYKAVYAEVLERKRKYDALVVSLDAVQLDYGS